jgi:hypothetical protein
VAKNASTSFYGNLVALSESPKKEGLIYVGSDDGLIQITEDGGANWRKLDKFPGVPDMTYVSRLLASQHDANTVYAAFDNHKNNDFAPYLLKSVDGGKRWISIKGDLPANGPVLAIAEDHVNANLIFVGTEFGLYFTIDGGQKWIRLKGGMPTIAVRDLAIQKQENDLVVATFGRGIYVLDDYTPLRMLKPEMLKQECMIFPIKDALMYIQTHPIGDRGKAAQGESFFTGENAPYGATITYYLKDSLKTRKQKRHEAEKEADKKKTEVKYPTNDELRQEDEENAPEIVLTISDAAGNVVRYLNGSAEAGFHRVTWNMRYPPNSLGKPQQSEEEDESDDLTMEDTSGLLVMPGKYKISIAKRINNEFTPLADAALFTIVVDNLATETDRVASVEFQQKVARLQRAVSGALETANGLKAKLVLIKRALKETPASAKLMDDALDIEQRNFNLLRALRGDNALRSRNENIPISISERVGTIVEDERLSTARPTQTQINAYNIAAEEFQQELTKLRQLIDVDVKKLESAMEAAGAPWTPGRIPDWKAN